MNNMPAITGWNWLKEGTALFRKQPAALTTLLFANILISLLISAVPLLGPLMAMVLIPSFSLAFMKACLMIENGERVTPAVVMTGFQQAGAGRAVQDRPGLPGPVGAADACWPRVVVDSELHAQQVSQPADPKDAPPVPAWEFVRPCSRISALDAGVLIALCVRARR